MGRGSDVERELAKALDDAGYHVIRSPSSGGGTARDQPDLAYANGAKKVVLELKYTGGDTAYYAAEEVKALTRFGTAFGAEALLCARFKQDTSFYVATPGEARRTPEGNYAIDRDMELPTVL